MADPTWYIQRHTQRDELVVRVTVNETTSMLVIKMTFVTYDSSTIIFRVPCVVIVCGKDEMTVGIVGLRYSQHIQMIRGVGQLWHLVPAMIYLDYGVIFCTFFTKG